MTDAPSPRPPVLPAWLLSRSEALRQHAPTDPSDLRQPQPDALRAHAEARTFLQPFTRAVQALSDVTGVPVVQRADGVKRLERYVEKYLEYDVIPLDILAAKLVFPTLQALYEAAPQVSRVLTVAGFRDRFVQPRSSGYRDLQFVVDLGGHSAEIKLCHELFDQLDAHEHTLYELRRSLGARTALTSIDALVLDKLGTVSADLFDAVWRRVLSEEGNDEQRSALSGG
jgi:hypothetical protein